MTRKDKIRKLNEAANMLARAEDLIRSTKEEDLIMEVANKIDSNDIAEEGVGLFERVCEVLQELEMELNS